MSDKAYFEPFLEHRSIIFNGMFTIMDPVYGTSEINPIMLSIPKHAKGVLQNLNKPSPPPVRLPQSESSKAKQNSPGRKQTVAQNLPSPSAPSAPQESSQTKQSPRQDAPQLTINPTITNFIQDDPAFAFQPLPLKCLAELLINVKKSDKGMRFDLFSDTNLPSILRSAVNGNSVNNTVQFKFNNSVQVATRYDQNKSAFYAILKDGSQEPTEICSARYTERKEFELLIPALKKNKQTGKGYSCFIPTLQNESALLSKFEQKSKEVIRLLPRKQNSVNDPIQSFALYHESNQSKDICNFGDKKGPNYGILILSYPLNIFQAFFATMAANLTH